MGFGGMSLAVLTEVGIMADSALVADTSDVRFGLASRTKSAITIDATVKLLAALPVTKRLVKSCKPMTSMSSRSGLRALGAEVPIRTGETLVSNANNLLHTSQLRNTTPLDKTNLIASVASRLVN